MSTGKVKWFDVAKRFGFITPDDGGRDVFLHLSNMDESPCPLLQPSLRLQFIVEQKGDKLTAKQVRTLPTDDRTRSVAASSKKGLAEFNEKFEREWGLRPI